MNTRTIFALCVVFLLSACGGAPLPIEPPVLEEVSATGEASVFASWYGLTLGASVTAECEYAPSDVENVATNESGCALVACIDVAGLTHCEVVTTTEEEPELPE